MKNSFVLFRAIAVLLLAAACCFTMLPSAFADDASDRAATEDLLTSNPWKITFQKGWSIVRTYNKDGSFSTPGRPDESGQWRVAGKTVVQIYPDGRKDAFDLPLNANGTTGVARDGETLNAVQVIGAEAQEAVESGGMSDQDRDAAEAVLLSGTWKFTGIGWGGMRTFARDGTFSIAGRNEPAGRWKIAKNVVNITYSGRSEIIPLPLDPKGSKGADPNGRPFTAVLLSAVAAAPGSSPAPGPAAPVMKAPDTAAVAAQLVAVPWRFMGTWWYAVRVLAKDGTFTTKGHGESGTWAIENNTVALTFPDGHKDSFPLPLDPKGMHGADKEGNPVVITAGKPDPTPPPAHPHSDLDFLSATPTPGPQEIARQNAAVAAVLVSGPWKFTGRSWTVTRIFGKDGTFTTDKQPNEYGSWKIADGKVSLIYQDGHIDTLDLPLDPKGTDGADRVGIPVIAVLLDSATAPTPAPTSAPVASNPGSAFGTSSPPPAPPRPVRPQGPTPPPFGTALPPTDTH